MKWRVLFELTEANGTVETQEIFAGHQPPNAISPDSIGLTLAESKSVLAAVQAKLVQAQAQEYCDLRRKCSYCGTFRGLKDWRQRRLTTLFGIVELKASRFNSCRCGVSPLAGF
jgi:hypothetical protein